MHLRRLELASRNLLPRMLSPMLELEAPILLHTMGMVDDEGLKGVVNWTDVNRRPELPPIKVRAQIWSRHRSSPRYE